MRICVIGLGSIGRRHARNCRTLGHDVVAIDPARDAAQAFCRAEGIGYLGPDIDVLNGAGTEACVVASPHHLHLDQAQAALGCANHVLIEKPLGLDLDAAAGFAIRARDADHIVRVACNMRFHPGIRALSDNLHRLGRIHFAQAHFGSYLPDMRPGVDHRQTYAASALEGGAILDGVHELDIVTHLLGAVEASEGFAATIDARLDIQAEDFGHMSNRHVSGAISLVTLDYVQRFKTRGCRIVGENGVLEWRGLGKSPETLTVQFTDNDGHVSGIASDKDVDKNAPYLDMMRDFTGAIDGQADRLQTVDEAVCILEMSLQARERRLDQRP